MVRSKVAVLAGSLMGLLVYSLRNLEFVLSHGVVALPVTALSRVRPREEK